DDQTRPEDPRHLARHEAAKLEPPDDARQEAEPAEVRVLDADQRVEPLGADEALVRVAGGLEVHYPRPMAVPSRAAPVGASRRARSESRSGIWHGLLGDTTVSGASWWLIPCPHLPRDGAPDDRQHQPSIGRFPDMRGHSTMTYHPRCAGTSPMARVAVRSVAGLRRRRPGF